MSDEKTGAKQATAYPLRMPSELREKLQARADAAGRSLNHEIVEILKKSVGPPPEVPRGLHQIVEAATTGTGESIEEAAVRLVVLGIQSQGFRQKAEAVAAAERYRTVALHQMLHAANEQLGELLQYLASVRGIDPDRLAAAQRHKESIARRVGQLDLSITAGLSSIE
jgi:plasmid stability protein